MNKILALLVLVILAGTIQAETITYKWTYEGKSNLLWTNPAAWDVGKVPGPSDDVVIIGDTNDYSGSTSQSIDLGSAAVTVHSLYIDASDVLIKFGGILTVANFTSEEHGHIKGSVAGATLVVTEDMYVEAFGEDNTIWDTIILNVTKNCNVTYWHVTGIDLPHSTFNNLGEWNFIYGGELDSVGNGKPNAQQTFTFNNWGLINFVVYDESDDEFVFWAKAVNNYGTFHIHPGAYVQLAQAEASVISTIFYNYGVLGLEGTLETNDGSQTNLTHTTTLMPGIDNNGTFYMLSYGSQYAIIRIDFNLNLPMGTIQFAGGPGRIEGTGSVSVGNLILQTGGIIAGSGPFLVHNITLTSNEYGTDEVASQLLRNVTVNGYWSQGDGLDFGNSAWFICSATCEATFYTGGFEQAARDNTKCGLINYGVIESYTDVLAYFENFLPTYNYGIITVPDFYTDPVFGGPCGLEFQGGTFTGSLTMFNRSYPTFVDYFAAYEDDDDDSYFTFFGPNLHMTSTVTLHGGQFDFNTAGNDYSFVDPGDYANAAIFWAGRTTPVGDGVILLQEGVRMIISGPGIVWERSSIIGGSIEGTNNLTIVMGKRIDAGYNAIFQINGTNVIITQNFTMETESVTFNANGKLIIQPSATLYCGGGLDLDTHIENDDFNGTEGVYNYGLTVFSVDQNDYTHITGEADFFNYGTIMLNTSISDETEPYGSYLWFQNNIFLQYGSASIILNVWKSGDSDYVSIFPESGTCYFSGTLHFVFAFTPKAGAQFLAAQTQGYINDGTYDQFSCGGLYTVVVSGSPLPSGTKAIILYDNIVSEGEEAVNHYLYICPSTNTTCTNYQRNPAYVNRDIPPGFPVITTTASSTTAKATTASTASAISSTTAKATTTAATSSVTTTAKSTTAATNGATTVATNGATSSATVSTTTSGSVTSATAGAISTGQATSTATSASGTTSSTASGSTVSSTSKSTTASATSAGTPVPTKKATVTSGNSTTMGNNTSVNSAVTLMANQITLFVSVLAAWCLVA